MPEQAVERKLVAILAGYSRRFALGGCALKARRSERKRDGWLRYLAIAIATVSLGGCAGTSIIPTGYPDEFFINEMVAPFIGGGVAARGIAIDEGVDFCRDHNRVFVLDHIRPGGDLRYPPTGSTVTFRCVLPGTALWQQPKKLTDWPSAER